MEGPVPQRIDPPPPLIIEHARARRVRLRIRRCGTLEVVVPPGFDRARLTALLARSGDWISRTRERLRQAAASLDAREQGPRPTLIRLRAIGQIWSVTWPVGPDAPVRTVIDDRCLTLPAGDVQTGHRHLLAWLKQVAGEHLTPRLDEIAGRHGLRFSRVGYRNQKTRWGSCSSRGTISLNVRLLFLPPALADYVLMHELCHTLHPHHGAGFWYELQRLCPQARRHDRALDKWRARLPDWLDAC